MTPSIPSSFTLHNDIPQNLSASKFEKIKGHLQCNSLLTNKNEWIAIKILDDNKTVEKKTLIQFLKDTWSGIKWKPVTLLDEKGKVVKVLVNVDSAVKSLKILGFSTDEVKGTLKRNTLLEDVLIKTLSNRIDSLYSNRLSENDRKQFVSHFSSWILKGEMSEADVDKLLKEAHRSNVSTIEGLILIKEKLLFNNAATHSSMFQQYTTEYSGFDKKQIFQAVKQITQEKNCTYETAIEEFINDEKASVAPLSSEFKLIKKIGENHHCSLSEAVKRFTSQRQQLIDKMTPFCQKSVEKEPLGNTLMEWLIKGDIEETDIRELLKGSQITGIEDLHVLKEKQLLKKEIQKSDQFKKYLHSYPWMAQSQQLWEEMKEIKQSKNCSYSEVVEEFLKGEKRNDYDYIRSIAQLKECSLKQATSIFNQKVEQLSEKIEPFCSDPFDKESFARALLIWVTLGEMTEGEIDTILNGKKISNYQELVRSKDFTVSLRGILNPADKAKTIQKAFKHFSFKKKINAQVTRMTTARKRQESRGKEKSLYEMEVNSQEKLEKARLGLKEWHAVSNLSLQNISSEKKALVEQNQTINEILSLVLEEMTKSTELMQKLKFKVVCDELNIIQGAALFKTGEKRNDTPIPLYISYISSAPWNLRNIEATQHDLRKVEGAATALIESAIYESIKTGTQGAVALEAVPLAVEFYEKMGFKRGRWFPSENGLISMELSIEEAQRFLASVKAGRALPIEEIDHITQIQNNKTDVTKSKSNMYKKILKISDKFLKRAG